MCVCKCACLYLCECTEALIAILKCRCALVVSYAIYHHNKISVSCQALQILIYYSFRLLDVSIDQAHIIRRCILRMSKREDQTAAARWSGGSGEFIKQQPIPIQCHHNFQVKCINNGRKLRERCSSQCNTLTNTTFSANQIPETNIHNIYKTWSVFFIIITSRAFYMKGKLERIESSQFLHLNKITHENTNKNPRGKQLMKTIDKSMKIQ